jgi:16S rRNA C1402 (ribose-2'-O) methylase RsmI
VTEEIENHLRQLRHSGVSAKDAVAGMAQETGLSKKELYQLWLKQD